MSLVVITDITDRRSTELALQQAQKLDAVGQLAGGIAHEFNNMLTAISGFARMAQRRVTDTARVESCLAEVVKAADRAAALTGQLLDFSRQRKTDQAIVINVVETVRELKSFLRPVLGETVTLAIAPRVGSASVRVDPARFTQAIVNLAINGATPSPSPERAAERLPSPWRPSMLPPAIRCTTTCPRCGGSGSRSSR